MKNTITLFIMLLIFSVSNAQLKVEDDSYIYVKDTYLYVEQDIDLAAGGNLYLRDESQLLQGSTGNTTNTGDGKLSVFQEGNATKYSYNYWCSPVVASGNSNFIPNQVLYDSTGTTSATIADFTPYSNPNGSGNPLTISSRWIYKFLPGSTYSDWSYVGSNGTVAPGYGFTMKGNNENINQRYDFRGIPNNGTIEIPVLNDQEVLVGNPYPSTIDLAAFLLDPDNIEALGGALFWVQDMSIESHNLSSYSGGYGTWIPAADLLGNVTTGAYTAATYSSYTSAGELVESPSGTNPSEGEDAIEARRYAPVGQGFIIRTVVTDANDGIIKFKNDYRTYVKENNSTSVFNKPAPVAYSENNSTNTNTELPNYVFQVVVNDTYTRDLMLLFHDNASLEFNLGFDGYASSMLSTDAAFDIAGNSYFIQGTNYDINAIVPMRFQTNGNEATFKILIGSYGGNVDTDQEVYVYDSLLEEYYEINSSTDYTFTTSDSVIENRYYIAFTDNSALSNEPIIAESDFLIHQNNVEKYLLMKNTAMYNVDAVNLYDMSGKLIFNKKNLGSESEYSFNTANLATGVYVVTINTENGQSISKKVTIAN